MRYEGTALVDAGVRDWPGWFSWEVTEAHFATQDRSNRRRRDRGSTLGRETIGTKLLMARFTAVPIAPGEWSTCSRAADSLPIRAIAPSASPTRFILATYLISETGSLIRWIGISDRQQRRCGVNPMRIAMNGCSRNRSRHRGRYFEIILRRQGVPFLCVYAIFLRVSARPDAP